MPAGQVTASTWLQFGSGDGLTSGTAFTPMPLSVASLPALPSGSNTIGTVNLGTIGTAATESSLSALNTKIPSNLTVTANRLLVDGSVGAVSPAIGSYATSGTPNTWTQALATNSSRKILFIQNLPTNTVNVDVGFGGSGSEALAMVLQPGDYVDAKNVPIGSRISCRSASASVPVIVWEA
jgi:hypothetical protein